MDKNTRLIELVTEINEYLFEEGMEDHWVEFSTTGYEYLMRADELIIYDNDVICDYEDIISELKSQRDFMNKLIEFFVRKFPNNDAALKYGLEEDEEE